MVPVKRRHRQVELRVEVRALQRRQAQVPLGNYKSEGFWLSQALLLVPWG